jgi:hypothetical protein
MNSHKDGYKCEATFNSYKEFNDYTKQRLTFSITKSSLVKCTICQSRNHKMRYKLGRCNAKSCNWKPKAKITVNENDEEPPMGRPPMAKGALEIEGTNLRRSQRNKK